MTQPKSTPPKASVRVYSDKGSLALCFSTKYNPVFEQLVGFTGRQKRMGLGIADDDKGWKKAQAVALQIEADLERSDWVKLFDPTFAKYGIGDAKFAQKLASVTQLPTATPQKIVVKYTSLLLIAIKPAKSKIKSLAINLVAFRSLGKIRIFNFLLLAFLLFSTSITVTLAQDRGADVLEYPTLRDILDRGNYAEAVERIEQNWENQYQEYFKENFSTRSQTADQIAKTLSRLAVQTKKKPALIYVLPRADQLELLLLTPDRPPFRQSVPAAKRDLLLPIVKEFTSELTNPRKINTTSYLSTAQQLYQWIIAPLESSLQLQKIDTLLFCVGSGLRTLPLPALHDGQRF